VEYVETVENVERQKVKSARDPVEFPAQFVEHHLKHHLKNGTSHDMICDYCPEPIKPSEKYFKILADHVAGPQIGHLTHLKVAPPREWKPDPAKTYKQPWETDPSIPTPPGWEEWKKKHEWAV
jgi:hypothetical protein